jgi:hypothetical protein
MESQMLDKYNVVFKGLLNGDISEEASKEKLVKFLKMSSRQADHLFANAPITIKKGIDREAALKYKKVFSQAGVLCEIETVKFELSLELRDDEKKEEEKVEKVESPPCPGCGNKHEKVGLCDECRSKIVNTPPQTHTAKLKSKILENKEEIKESIIDSFKDWVKGHIWASVVIIILIPFFGSKLIVSSIFYTKDKHLLYQTFQPVTLCVKDPGNFNIVRRKAETDLSIQFIHDFSKEESKENLSKWSNEACRSKFKLEMGNIGSEVIESTDLEFQTWRFLIPAKAKPVYLDVRSRDISAASAREKDPDVVINKGKIKLKNLYPGTLTTVYFEGWIDGRDAAVGWDRMMTNISINEGSIDVGSPSATAFAKLLTIFF